MLRITRLESRDAITALKLEGKVVGPWVGELREVCDRQAGAAGRLLLDLANVTYADVSGVRLLRELLGRGVQLKACSGLVAELLRGEGR
jgi:hypothetical protein